MKVIPILLGEDYKKRVVHRAIGLTVSRPDGVVFRFTSFQKKVKIGLTVYTPGLGLTSSQISSSLGMSVNDLQVSGPVDGSVSSSEISDDDLLAGKWENSFYEFFAFNPKDPSRGIEEITSGTFGKISKGVIAFTVELRDLLQYYQVTLGEVSTPTCRVQKLGDARCLVNLAPFTFAASVTAITSRSVFGASALIQGDNYFRFGELLWASGANIGLKGEVKIFVAGGVVGLQFPVPHNIAPGDAFTIIAGCDRSLAMCRDKFANVVNMVAEPHKPTGDQLMRGPV